MRKINTLKYEGFTTDFYVTDKVKKFLDENNVPHEDFLEDNYHWYEVFLFEQIDENTGENKLGKNFKVIYYGIVEKFTDKGEEGFEDNSDDKGKKIIGNWTSVVSETLKHKSFAINYKILVN